MLAEKRHQVLGDDWRGHLGVCWRKFFFNLHCNFLDLFWLLRNGWWSFSQSFLILESFIGIKKFGSSLEFLNFLRSNLVKIFLSVRSNLVQSPALHMFINLFPIFSISLQERLKKIRLRSCPPSTFLFLSLTSFLSCNPVILIVFFKHEIYTYCTINYNFLWYQNYHLKYRNLMISDPVNILYYQGSSSYTSMIVW